MRELHDHLSRYLRHVAEGREIFVTLRGRRVARLSSVEGQQPLADLRARGLVEEPKRPKASISADPLLESSAPVSELVAEQRR